MSPYRKIDTQTWGDAKFRRLSNSAKLVCIYIMTHPNLTMLGAMRATVPGLAAELGMALEDFQKAFGEVLAMDIVKIDEEASFLWLPNFLKYNRPESPNVVRAWPRTIDLLPECHLKIQLFELLKAFAEGMTEAFREAFREAFDRGSPNQEQEQQLKTNNERDAAEKSERMAYAPYLKTWNANRGSLSEIMKITDRRRDKLRTRIAEGLTVEAFRSIVITCATTPFLRGQNDTKWKVDFDWLIENDSNFTKVLEGKYGPPNAGKTEYLSENPYLDDPAYQTPVVSA